MKKLTSLFLPIAEKMALHNWEKYKFGQEWLWCIFLCLILKLATSAVSIFSGYFYLDNFFFGMFNNTSLSKFFAVVALLLIEGLAAFFLSKFFKFALRANFLTASGPLIGVALVFSLSFIVSTNGIATFTAENVDNSQTINAKYKVEIENLKKSEQAEIAVIEEQIITVKNNPSEWMNGKRCALSAAQLQHIQNLYNKIESVKASTKDDIKRIDSELKQELALNDANTLSEAGRFYKIVAVIMGLQFLLSGILMFFWSKIVAYKNPEVSEIEAYNNAEDNIINMVRSGFERVLSAEFSRYDQMFARIADKPLSEGQKEPATETKKPTQAPGIGFAAFASNPQTAISAGQKSSENGEENAAKNTVKTPQYETQQNATTAAVGVAFGTPQNIEKTDVKQAVGTVHTCLHCGAVLTPSQIAHKAKFCCKEHRREHWEVVNGKKLQHIKNEDLD